jgi:hypothetical protein
MDWLHLRHCSRVRGTNISFAIGQTNTPTNCRIEWFPSEGMFREEVGRVWHPGGEIQQPQVGLHRPAAIEVTVRFSTSVD